MNKLKNAYLYAYYECYLQEHFLYKSNHNKNFNANTTLGVVLVFLFLFPIMILVNKTIGIKKYMYILLVIIAYVHIFFTSRITGNDNDLTENINKFYADKKTVKQSKRIVLVFVILCVLFWVFAIRYDYD